MKYQFIQDHQYAHRITILCDALNIKRSSYYDWVTPAESRRERQNRNLLNRICAIHAASRENCVLILAYLIARRHMEVCINKELFKGEAQDE